MILSSMSVMFMTQVTGVAAPAQVPDEQVGEQERAEVADVGRTVDRRAARVDADAVVVERDERSRLARTACRAAGASSSGLDGRDGQRRDRPAGALGAVEVAGRGLDVDGAPRRRRAAPRSRRASGRDGRRAAAARDDRQIDGRRPPAGGLDPPSRPRRASSRCRCPPGVRASAGKSRPRSPSPAAPSSASHDRVERDVAVGVADQPRRALDRDAAEHERRARPERMAVVADTRSAAGRGRGRAPAPPARDRPGSVTLRLPGSPGTTWTSMLQASSRAASSVKVSGPSAGNRRHASRSRPRRDALRRLGGAEAGPLDRRRRPGRRRPA